MPQAPGPENVPQIPLQNTRDVVAIPRDPVPAEAQRTVDAAVEAVNRISDQQSQIALSQADTEMAVELDRIAERYRADDDWQTAPTRARAEAETMFRERGARLRGAAAQRAWSERTVERLGRFELGMRAQSRDRGAQLARANLTSLGQSAEALAGDLSQTEDARATAVNNYIASLDSAERAGLVDADDAARMEAAFSENVRRRVQDGLRAEVIERIEMDPADLAAELADDDGPFRMLDPDERARLTRQATQAAGAMAIDDALERTLRTGEIEGEDELGIDWSAMGDGARLRYAERASAMAEAHDLAAEMGSIAGLSLSEIAQRADAARAAGQANGGAAGAMLRTARRDPAAYVLSANPLVEQLAGEVVSARQALREAQGSGDAEAISAARTALRRAQNSYTSESLRAQDAMGIPPSRQRVYDEATISAWARRVAAMPETEQAAALGALTRQLQERFVNQDHIERAAAEHIEALTVARGQGMSAPPPAADVGAAQGYEPASVRAQITRAIENGHGLQDPYVQVLLARLAPAERARVEEALAGEE